MKVNNILTRFERLVKDDVGVPLYFYSLWGGWWVVSGWWQGDGTNRKDRETRAVRRGSRCRCVVLCGSRSRPRFFPPLRPVSKQGAYTPLYDHLFQRRSLSLLLFIMSKRKTRHCASTSRRCSALLCSEQRGRIATEWTVTSALFFGRAALCNVRTSSDIIH